MFFEDLLLRNINFIFVVLGVTARYIATSGDGFQRNLDISAQTMIWEHNRFYLKVELCVVYLAACLYVEIITIWR